MHDVSLRMPLREYRTWTVDSRRWQHYRPRNGDVVVATYPKSGTTWTQRIISLLIFKSAEVYPLDKTFPWWEFRAGLPIEDVVAAFESRTHQRSVKTHLPLDGLPLFENVKYIHVARDPRDACLSYQNHTTGFTPEALAQMSEIGLADETLRKPYPRVSTDPAEFFHQWLTEGSIAGQSDGMPFLSYFEYEKTFWDCRHLKNILFVHYRDLSADLVGEMERIARFIGVDLPRVRLAELAQEANFDSMQRDGGSLIPETAKTFEGGAERLFHKGQSGRWQSFFKIDDLQLFEHKLRQALPPDYGRWLIEGRLSGVDPALS